MRLVWPGATDARPTIRVIGVAALDPAAAAARRAESAYGRRGTSLRGERARRGQPRRRRAAAAGAAAAAAARPGPGRVTVPVVTVPVTDQPVRRPTD
jgi:hypothetical protein